MVMSVAGLQVFNENGDLTYSVTTNTTRLIGSGTTGTVNGSLVDERIVGQKVWILITRYHGTSSEVNIPSFSYNHNVISWNFRSMTGANYVSCDFIYGVY